MFLTAPKRGVPTAKSKSGRDVSAHSRFHGSTQHTLAALPTISQALGDRDKHGSHTPGDHSLTGDTGTSRTHYKTGGEQSWGEERSWAMEAPRQGWQRGLNTGAGGPSSEGEQGHLVNGQEEDHGWEGWS